jgi:hypothetical protein
MIDDIKRHEWRQGDILPADARQAIQSHIDVELFHNDCCIIASQSCDVLCADFAAEPAVELVIARPVAGAADGNYTFAKNARRLHLEVLIDTEPRIYEALANERRSFPRHHLATYAPDTRRRLSADTTEQIVQWLVSRYRRKAFPDAFNARTAVVFDRKIKPRLKRLTQVTALYVALSRWDELPPGVDYKMVLLGTMLRSQYTDPALRAAAETGIGEIAASLATCVGIDVEDFAVRSEADVTLDEARQLSRWHLDYVSLGDSAKHAPLPP